MKTTLRLFLDDELEAMKEQAALAEKYLVEFWRHPEKNDPAVWAYPVAPENIEQPPKGSVTEKAFYRQWMIWVKPGIELNRYGFRTAPALVAHEEFCPGPPFGTHFLAAVLGETGRTNEEGIACLLKELEDIKSLFES